MIHSAGMCSSFKRDLLLAKHDFSSHQFYIALYDSTAELDVDSTTGYITQGEISGDGYTPGGRQLTGVQILGPVARAAYVTWDDPIWPASSLTARGAMIYNQSSGQGAVLIVDFGSDVTSNQGDFWVQLPPPSPSSAAVRLQ